MEAAVGSSTTVEVDSVKFTLTDRVGEGSWGQIFRAVSENGEAANKAIKIPLPGTLLVSNHTSTTWNEASGDHTFSDETRAYATMQSVGHPYVVRIDAVEEGDRHPFIAMELIDTSFSVVDVADISIEKLKDTKDTSYSHKEHERFVVNEIGGRVASLLKGCHTAGVVVCDLKPDELFVRFEEGPEGNGTWSNLAGIKLADCGEIRPIGDKRTWTVCTPPFSAPEQYDDSAAADRGFDFWALGMMLASFLADEPREKIAELAGTMRHVSSEEARAEALTVIKSYRENWEDHDLRLRASGPVEKLLSLDPEERVEAATELWYTGGKTGAGIAQDLLETDCQSRNFSSSRQAPLPLHGDKDGAASESNGSLDDAAEETDSGGGSGEMSGETSHELLTARGDDVKNLQDRLAKISLGTPPHDNAAAASDLTTSPKQEIQDRCGRRLEQQPQTNMAPLLPSSSEDSDAAGQVVLTADKDGSDLHRQGGACPVDEQGMSSPSPPATGGDRSPAAEVPADDEASERPEEEECESLRAKLAAACEENARKDLEIERLKGHATDAEAGGVGKQVAEEGGVLEAAVEVVDRMLWDLYTANGHDRFLKKTAFDTLKGNPEFALSNPRLRKLTSSRMLTGFIKQYLKGSWKETKGLKCEQDARTWMNHWTATNARMSQ